jgi:hypothetical protein
MSKALICATAMAALLLAGCQRNSDDSAAKEAGRAAYKLREQSEKAAKRVGKELREAGKDAREGWNEARKENKAKAPEAGKRPRE